MGLPSSRVVSVVLFLQLILSGVLQARDQVDQKGHQNEDHVDVAKCCEQDELLLDGACEPLAQANQTFSWQPEFEAEDAYPGAPKPPQPRYKLHYGHPKCPPGSSPWDVYHYPKSGDTLAILLSGTLRHSVPDQADEVERAKELYGTDFLDPEDVQAKAIHFDYPYGHYCADKAVLTKNPLVAVYAKICVPRPMKWANTDSLIKKALDPAFHAIAMVSYLIVAIIYFVLPQLRDLVGNIITSTMICLIVSQCASFINIFTEFGNHINFFITDSIMYISLLAAFFWLHALGYYVWSTFRSRNVFIRSSDGKKYCCYSTFVWGCTISIAATAMFAHFTLETSKPIVGGVSFEAQETLGGLALSVLFTSVAFTIAIDVCYITTTMDKLKRIRTYGRIHHKMKYNFRMFMFILATMGISWLFLLLSLLKYDALIYCHIFVNLIQALFILYICIFGQKRVTFLLGKTCNCCVTAESPEGLDWGEEMTAINAGY
ncbi:hypothetical protein QAD02_001701 [Eretmocerus hayati]|uniref:Uncharacterized protein n=1 Tax=Eretmocerus hayati TaxID=131215 RepID=A0ACC2NH61_9HYME|nr:hypothetical protein QAD02_001701 [Eretmocerus hayati]